MNHRTSFLIGLFLLAFTGQPFAKTALNAPTLTKTFTMDGPGTLDVTTSGGGISVEGTSGNKVEVEVFIRKNGDVLSASDPLVKNLEEGYDLKMEKSGSTITLYAKRKSQVSSWRRLSISFRVSVPYEMSADLQTSGGGLKVMGIKGTHQLNTSGGGINLENVSGNTVGRTSGGGIKVINQKGDAELRTSGGGIRISGSEGNIFARTSGGGINLEDNKGRVDVSTSGGRIYINGEARSVKASTSGGGITANITGLSEELSLSTSGGRIDVTVPKGLGVDLDLHARKVNVEMSDFSGSSREGRVNGSMNGGGIPVYMKASGGNIDFSFK